MPSLRILVQSLEPVRHAHSRRSLSVGLRLERRTTQFYRVPVLSLHLLLRGQLLVALKKPIAHVAPRLDTFAEKFLNLLYKFTFFFLFLFFACQVEQRVKYRLSALALWLQDRWCERALLLKLLLL